MTKEEVDQLVEGSEVDRKRAHYLAGCKMPATPNEARELVGKRPGFSEQDYLRWREARRLLDLEAEAIRLVGTWAVDAENDPIFLRVPSMSFGELSKTVIEYQERSDR